MKSFSIGLSLLILFFCSLPAFSSDTLTPAKSRSSCGGETRYNLANGYIVPLRRRF